MKPAEQEALALLERFAERFTTQPCGGPKTKRWATKLWQSGRVLLGRRRRARNRIANPPILKAISNIANYAHDEEFEDLRNQIYDQNWEGVHGHVYKDILRVLMWLRGSDKGWRDEFDRIVQENMRDD